VFRVEENMSVPEDRPSPAVRRSGGRDNIAGTNLQHLITAWGLVLLMAEQLATPPFEWPATSVVTLIRAETEQPTDDVLIGNSEANFAFVQAKQRVTLSTVADSPLDKSVAQFCRQAWVGAQPSRYPWQRPYRPGHDHFVLATGAESPDTVTRHLRAVLQQVSSAGPAVPLSDRAFNANEQAALDTVITLIGRYWTTLAGRAPTEAELRELLQLIRVQVFDFTAGGSQLNEALSLLRTQILARPADAEAAWAGLVTFAATLGEHSGGLDQAGVRTEVRRLGFPLLEPPDYREDVERLRAFAVATEAKLAPLGRLDWEGRRINLDRAVTHAVVEAGQRGSMLVTGEPGAGKSGVILDAFRAVRASGGDPLLIAVDGIAAGSLDQLQHELSLSRPLIDVLRSWPEAGQRVLFLDAMDAARSDERIRTLRDLIEAIKLGAPEWHVVASMRQFDLRYSSRLQSLFHGPPPSKWSLPEFSHLTHIVVPPFTDEEWADLIHEIPAVEALAENGTDPLRTLLRSPFNLRLVTEILAASTESRQLNAIETQGQLLEAYWKARVTPTSRDPYAREDMLWHVVTAAVEHRSLKVLRRDLPTDHTSLQGLITDGVLTEWQPPGAARPDSAQITFTHHLLFDEAAARLVFTESELLPRLAQDRELSVVYRPSIERRLQMIWEAVSDHQTYWNLAVALKLTPGIPQITQALPLLVATQLATRIEDFMPLLHAVEGEHRAEAVWLLHILISSLMSRRVEVELNQGLWGELAERLSRLDDIQEVPNILRRLLQLLTRGSAVAERGSPDAATGRAARRYLAQSWNAPEPSGGAIGVGIDAVINTATTDLPATVALLSQAFEPARVDTQGYLLLPQLAQHGQRLFALSPDFALKLFETVFGWEETSEEKTVMSASTLIPLSSTRRQDYSMARYALGEVFPEFLAGAPEEATRALMHALTHSQQAKRRDLKLTTTKFQGVEVQVGEIREWDDETYFDSYSAEKLLLEDLRAFVLELGRAGNLVGWDRVLSVVAAHNRRPLVWRTVFKWAAELPTEFQRRLLPLLRSPVVLAGWTTRDTVGEFLQAGYARLTADERGAIEEAILRLPDHVEEPEDVMRQARDQLLGCLPEALVVRPETQNLIRELKEDGPLPLNMPIVQFGVWEHKSSTLISPPTLTSVLQEDLRLLHHFGNEFRNKAITAQAALSVQPSLKRVYQSRAGQWNSSDRDDLTLSMWDNCVQAAEITSRLVDDLPANDERLRLSREILLEAANDPLPEHAKSQFDEHGSWASPAPRVEAAIGLSHLLRVNPEDPTLRAAVTALIDDPAPEVRSQAAASARSWGWSAPDAYWQTLSAQLATETSQRVLTSWMVSTKSFVQSDPQRVFDAVQAVMARTSVASEKPGRHDQQVAQIAQLLAGTGFYAGHPPSGRSDRLER